MVAFESPFQFERDSILEDGGWVRFHLNLNHINGTKSNQLRPSPL